MITTFVHIGDFHARQDARNPARYAALGQINSEAKRVPNLGAWLWPGDLNDARMSIEDRNALATYLQAMAGVAPVILCYGNHDLPGDLDVFGRLSSIFPIYVVSTPQTIRVKIATGGFASIFVLPYPTKAGLTAQGIAKGDVVDAAGDLLEPIFMQAAADLEAARKNGDITLMIGHVNVAGSRTSVGQPNIGHEIELSPRHLDRLGPIYKGLNHIHVAQEIAGAHYAGSVCRLNWGEIEEKRYLTITHQENPHDGWRWPYSVTSHPIDIAPMYHVEGTLTRDGFTWAVTKGPGGDVLPAPASWKGCEVRVRYRFNQSEKSVLRDAVVLAEFAEAAKLEVEPIAVPDRALRAPEVAEARTLPEKIRAWATSTGVALPASAVDKLAQLDAGDSFQILTDVQAAIAAIEQPEKATVAA